MATNITVSEPFPIHDISGQYLLFDADTVAHCRRKYNIAGVLIGGLPQAPQQNVFLGLPLELMPEEARILVEKKVGYIVNDTAQHRAAFLAQGLSDVEKAKFEQLLQKQGIEAAQAQSQRSASKREDALKRLGLEIPEDAQKLSDERVKTGESDMNNWNDLPEMMLTASRPRTSRAKSRRRGDEQRSASSSIAPGVRNPEMLSPIGDSVLLDASPVTRGLSNVQSQSLTPYGVTPPTSYPPLSAKPPPPRKSTSPSCPPRISASSQSLKTLNETSASTEESRESNLPGVPVSYPLYKYLHSKEYFLTPGMRFGCQYTAYPGDPLRYHSHFLCTGKKWTEDFDLMEIVGGGRLGTGVKKGFLIGGVEPRNEEDKMGNGDENVRAFVVEWSGM